MSLYKQRHWLNGLVSRLWTYYATVLRQLGRSRRDELFYRILLLRNRIQGSISFFFDDFRLLIYLNI